MSGAEQLRRAVNLLDSNKEDFNEEYTAEELLKIVRACWLSEWDVMPDEWTQSQVEAAIAHGTPPQFEELATGLHAVGVKDCYCRRCQKERASQSRAEHAIMDSPR